MGTNWRTAPDVKKIGDKLIVDHHPHLYGVDIRYVYRSKTQISNGKEVWGTCRLKTGMDAMFGMGAADSCDKAFFVIEVAEEVWAELDPPEQEALVDHELCHARAEVDNGVRKLSLVGHDVEEFGDILQRHGLWRESIAKTLSKVGKTQLELFAKGL